MALAKALIFSTTTRQGGPQLANSVSSATGVFGAIYGDFKVVLTNNNGSLTV